MMTGNLEAPGHWKYVVREKNYSPDCMAGEDEGKSGHFQCAVHLPVDKWNWHKNFLNLRIRGVFMTVHCTVAGACKNPNAISQHILTVITIQRCA